MDVDGLYLTLLSYVYISGFAKNSYGETRFHSRLELKNKLCNKHPETSDRQQFVTLIP